MKEAGLLSPCPDGRLVEMSLSVSNVFPDDISVMRHALEIARRGIGRVEPNPAVGAVIVDENGNWVADGFHEQFGGPHAEANAIAAAEGKTRGAQLFVTLEPCSHHGKTPPCADAVIAAGFRRVIVGCQDPAPHVAGQGIAKLRDAGIEVDVGLCEPEATQLIAPFRKLTLEGRPWVHAKWAMTLDGRIATRTGHSKWISNEQSRAEVHRLRGHMDAIITGAGTVRADNPTLTARPAGPRTALRIVFDKDAKSLKEDGHLIQSLDQAPLLICVAKEHAGSVHVVRLQKAGAEILALQSDDPTRQVDELLSELGRRQQTNVLLEAGPGLMGTFFDANAVDEVHVFIAPKIVGGDGARSPIGGIGIEDIPQESSLSGGRVRMFGADVLLEGRLRR